MSNYINKENKCQIHQKEYTLFCDDCKEKLCEKCKGEHKEHSIKSFIDIIPNNKDIKSINSIYKKIMKKYNQLLKK